MHQAPPNRSNSTWTPSTDLCMKCNVDATVFKDTINFSVLACMKDSGGGFIAARPQVYQGDPTPQEAKVVASLTALKWISNSQLANVIVELACKANMEAINIKNFANNKARDRLRQCLDTKNSLINYQT